MFDFAFKYGTQMMQIFFGNLEIFVKSCMDGWLDAYFLR